jgi:hypothetical protein
VIRRFLSLLLVSAACVMPQANARVFENNYLSFSMPDGWSCILEGTEYVCRPPNPAGKKFAITFIMAAKEVGPQDTLAAYTAHLARNPPPRGTLLKAPVHRNVSGTLWVDATLADSEIKGYHTRYLGTVKDGVAVLMTISVHKNFLAQYEGVASVAADTLKVKPLPPKGATR